MCEYISIINNNNNNNNNGRKTQIPRYNLHIIIDKNTRFKNKLMNKIILSN